MMDDGNRRRILKGQFIMSFMGEVITEKVKREGGGYG